jgi:excisionase family DNA binding protein
MVNDSTLLTEIRDELRSISKLTSWDKPVLSQYEVAEMLGLSPKTIGELARHGRIPAYQPPGVRKWMFLPDEILQWIKIGKHNDVGAVTELMEDARRVAGIVLRESVPQPSAQDSRTKKLGETRQEDD